MKEPYIHLFQDICILPLNALQIQSEVISRLSHYDFNSIESGSIERRTHYVQPMICFGSASSILNLPY